MPLNNEQKKAVECEESDILVSASAGTGKTKVLTSRIIKRICDRKISFDNILVTTFTKAAAAEMKAKIAKEMRSLIATETDGEKRNLLRNEYYKLDRAEIGTIDSFCLNTVKRYFSSIGLPPDVRICDTTEAMQIFGGVFNMVLAEFTNSHSEKYRATLLDSLDCITDSADKITESVYSLYSKLVMCSDGIDGALDKTIGEYKTIKRDGFFASYWGKRYLKYKAEELKYYKNFTTYLANIFVDMGKDKDANKYKDLSNFCAHCEEHLSNGNIQLAINAFETEYMRGTSYARQGIYEKITKIRENITKSGGKLDVLNTELNALSSENYPEIDRHIAVAEDIKEFMLCLDEKYTDAKYKRGLIEFADANILTKKLLCDNAVAKEICGRYKEIYIDEYQDVSHIQDDIFSIMQKNGCRRFMVGDVKQLIYSFRNSDPKIFNAYRENGNVEKIFLKQNYRSTKEILDFANVVSGKMLGNAGETSVYTSDDDLVPGENEKHEVKRGAKPEIYIISRARSSSDSGKCPDRGVAAADFTAKKIKEYVENGKAKYSDVCILVRTGKVGEKFTEELAKNGIPCVYSDKQNLLEYPEVMFTVSLLNVINSPYYDLHLAAVLKSPIFNFTLTDLANIKLYAKECGMSKEPLYAQLEKYSEDNNFEKGNSFITRLKDYRTRASLPADELLWYLYGETKIFGYLHDKNGDGAVKKPLNALLTLARSFEMGRFRGLYDFISYINELIAGGEKLEFSGVAEGDTVKIQTIHKSKGLQYPIVFMYMVEKPQHNNDDGWNIDSDGRFTFNLFDIDTYSKTKTQTCKTAKEIISKEAELADDARLVYVGLTRAEKELILIGEYGNGNTKEETTAEQIRDVVEAAKSVYLSCGESKKKYYLDEWLSFVPTAVSADSGEYGYTVLSARNLLTSASAEDGECEMHTETPEPTDIEINDIRARAEYVYVPYANVPAKLSVSKLSPDILDENEGEDYDESELEKAESTPKTPQFMLTERKATSAEKGTATHAFMQFCDFKKIAEPGGIDFEISRLTNEKYISGAQAELIDKTIIEGFVKSPLYREITESKYVLREQRFFLSVSADTLTKQPENKERLKNRQVLVQGAIDCIYENPDGTLSVTDYKTDRIPGDTSEKDFEKLLSERHGKQLKYYKDAAEKIILKKVSKVSVYSFALGKEVIIG